jgi:hypothetical protein
MNSSKKLVAIIGIFFAILMVSSPLFAGKEGIKIGTLTIKTVPGTRHNLIVTSSADLKATFTDANGKKEHYIGEMGIKLGVDLSFKTDEVFGYAVFSASTDYKTGSYDLQGKYFGADASAAYGVGPSVKVLVGGSDKSFSLQPLALGGSKGVGAAAGLGYLYLQKAPKK